MTSAASCSNATPLNDATISRANAVSYNIIVGNSFTATSPLFATNQSLSAVVGGVLLTN